MQQIALPRRDFGLVLPATLLLFLAGLILPNLLSLGALVSGMGFPPRTVPIILYAMVAVLARRAPPTLIVPAFFAVTIYDAISTLALQFGLAPSEIGLAVHLAGELDFFRSPLYLTMIAGGITVMSAVVFLLVRYREQMKAGSVNLFLSAVLLFAAADFAFNTSAHYQFGSLYGVNQPMKSAAEASGFRDAVLTQNPPRVLMIVVEALGKFADPAKQEILLRPFQSASLQKNYRVTTGSTTYYGSTTAGEMRELCDTRAPYEEVAAKHGADCLPKLLAERGHETIALHNFTSKFFGRSQWYPQLGFKSALFQEDMETQNIRQCGGPFRAPCDAQMLPRITRAFQDAKGPLFYYWLTLSTHVPIMLSEATPRLNCTNRGGALGHEEVCNMTEMWLDIFEGVAAMTEAIGPTEILIVGDHGPPLWSRAGRSLFAPGEVTWIRLAPRGASAE